MCARTVLNIQWPQLDEDNSVKQNFCKTVENVHEILTGLGFNRFQLILDLMENHWTHPTLTQIMSGDDEDEIEDGRCGFTHFCLNEPRHEKTCLQGFRPDKT